MFLILLKAILIILFAFASPVSGNFNIDCDICAFIKNKKNKWRKNKDVKNSQKSLVLESNLTLGEFSDGNECDHHFNYFTK